MNSRPKPGRTKYNSDWENPTLHPDIAPWIKAIDTGNSLEDMYYFQCKVCNSGKISLSNMGIGAVKKHMTDPKGKECKHNLKMKSLKGIRQDCFQPKDSNKSSSQCPINGQPSIEVSPQSVSTPVSFSVSKTSTESSVTKSKSSKPCQSRLDTAPPEVVKSMILWALNVVRNHYSMRSAGGIGDLFQGMFPDSEIAKHFALSAGKLSYVIHHGLAPYFKVEIIKELKPKGPRLPLKFVSCFDESFNKVTYSKQMDVHLIYYKEETNQVERVYLDSQFMGHGAADNVMDEFKRVHKELDIVNNLVQLSMDGPNVNWAFLDALERYRKEEDPSSPSLLNIGSCGLHVLHGAYKTGHSKVDWDVDKTLKAAHGIFKQSPARRADYLADNDIIDQPNDQAKKSLFPLKFCGHRWLENGKAITRFLEILNKIVIYLTQSKERKAWPAKDERFPLLFKNTKSKIFPAYCEFSLSICRDIEPFLTLFQSEKPLAMFLYTKLKELITSLLERFVRSDVIESNLSAYKMINLDLNKIENLLPIESINVGVGAKSVLSKLTTTEKTLERQFRSDVRKFLIHLLQKLFQRSPLKYKLTRTISSLSPIEIKNMKPEVLKKRFNSLVIFLHDHRWISSAAADNAEKQYNTLIKNSDFLAEAKRFSISDDRVDTFYARILDSSNTVDLQNIVRLILILSHGNARVESGFSINDDILLPNMLAETIVSQRIVFEAVQRAGSPNKVEITRQLMKMVRNSHKSYSVAQDEKKQQQSDAQKRVVEKRKATVDLQNAVANKKAAVDELRNKINIFDSEIQALQEKLRK